MTDQPERVIVKETSNSYLIDHTTFSGAIPLIVSTLQRHLEDGWEGVDYKPFGYSGAVEFFLYRHRLETDQEYSKRLIALGKKEMKEAIAKERRRKQYEKLREEFEND